MLSLSFSHIGFLFLAYSVLGWICESFIASIIIKRFFNRGFLFGPYCPAYGIGMLVLVIVTQYYIDNPALVFLSAALLITLEELITNRLFEYLFQIKCKKRYKEKKQVIGWIEIINFIIFGLAGTLAVYFVQPLLDSAVNWFNPASLRVLISLVLAIMIIDMIFSIASIINPGMRKSSVFSRMAPLGHTDEYRFFKEEKNKLNQDMRHLIGRHRDGWLRKKVSRKSHVSIKESLRISYSDLSVAKLIWVFFIGCVMGYVMETLFCVLQNGYFESRQGMLYGPFSQVYGLGAVILVLLLNPISKKKMIWIYLASAVIGGLFEAGVSLMQEIMFGSTSWNYSSQPLNMFGGRTGVIYMLFWGIAGTVYIRLIYPKISSLVDDIPARPKRILTIVIAVVFSLNLLISGIAVNRWQNRQHDVLPANRFDKFIDNHYNDAFMRDVYPHMKIS